MHFACIFSVLDPDLLMRKRFCPQKPGKSLLLYFPIFSKSAFSHILNKLPEGLHESHMIYTLLEFGAIARQIEFSVAESMIIFKLQNFAYSKIIHEIGWNMAWVRCRSRCFGVTGPSLR